MTPFSRKQAAEWLADYPARCRGATAAEREGYRRLLVKLTGGLTARRVVQLES